MRILLSVFGIFFIVFSAIILYGSVWKTDIDETVVFIKDGEIIKVDATRRSGWQLRPPFRSYVLVTKRSMEAKMGDVFVKSADGVECEINGLSIVYRFTDPGIAAEALPRKVKDRKLTTAEPVLETLYPALVQSKIKNIEAIEIQRLSADFWRLDEITDAARAYGVTIDFITPPTAISCPAEPTPLIQPRPFPRSLHVIPDRYRKKLDNPEQ